jgi:hypothetical protein
MKKLAFLCLVALLVGGCATVATDMQSPAAGDDGQASGCTAAPAKPEPRERPPAPGERPRRPDLGPTGIIQSGPEPPPLI